MKKSDKEVIELYQKLNQIYTKKFHYSLIDDIKSYTEYLIKNTIRNGSTKQNKLIPILNNLLSIINKGEFKNTDVDPFGEEEWDENNKNIISPDTISAMKNFAYQTHGFYRFISTLERLKQLLKGKTVTFIENENDNDYFNIIPFKTKIRVKDIKWEGEEYPIILIDENDKLHFTFLPYGNPRIGNCNITLLD
jgi:hypothetical protein